MPVLAEQSVVTRGAKVTGKLLLGSRKPECRSVGLTKYNVCHPERGE